MRVLILNADPDEAARYASMLTPPHEVEVRSQWERAGLDLAGYNVLLLDTGFNENHGFDLLMETGATAKLAVLLVTDPAEPLVAIEARRLGVFNYVVKTPQLEPVLRVAVAEAANQFADAREQQKFIERLKSRVAELETRIRAAPGTPAGGSAAPEVVRLQRRKRLFEQLMLRIGKGDLQVPSLPEIPAKLRELLQQDPEVADIAALLNQDASIAARLIGMANSAYYASYKTCYTLEQAIGTLGFNETWRHVELLANRNLYTLSSGRYKSLLKPLWIHGAASAHLSRALAVELKYAQPDLAFSMGLLHDIGHLFLIQLVADIDAEDGLDEPPSDEAMARFLDEYHGPFGARLMELWKLPDEYVQVARHHEAPPADESALPARIVRMADLMASNIGFADRSGEMPASDYEAAAAAIGIPSERLKEIERDVAKQLGDLTY